MEEGLRALVNGALELREVPLRILRIGVPHHIPHVAAVLDGGRHVPEATFIQGFPGEGSLLAVIRHQQKVPVAGDFISCEETPVLHPDLPLGAVGGIHHMDLVPLGLAVQVRLHEEQAVPAPIVSHFQLLVRGAVLHIHNAPIFMGEAGYGAAAGHIPPGPIGDGEIRGAGVYRRFPAEKGVSGIQFQVHGPAVFGQEIAHDNFPSASGHGHITAAACTFYGTLRAVNRSATGKYGLSAGLAHDSGIDVRRVTVQLQYSPIAQGSFRILRCPDCRYIFILRGCHLYPGIFSDSYHRAFTPVFNAGYVISSYCRQAIGCSCFIFRSIHSNLGIIPYGCTVCTPRRCSNAADHGVVMTRNMKCQVISNLPTTGSYINSPDLCSCPGNRFF